MDGLGTVGALALKSSGNFAIAVYHFPEDLVFWELRSADRETVPMSCFNPGSFYSPEG